MHIVCFLRVFRFVYTAWDGVEHKRRRRRRRGLDYKSQATGKMTNEDNNNNSCNNCENNGEMNTRAKQKWQQNLKSKSIYNV